MEELRDTTLGYHFKIDNLSLPYNCTKIYIEDLINLLQTEALCNLQKFLREGGVDYEGIDILELNELSEQIKDVHGAEYINHPLVKNRNAKLERNLIEAIANSKEELLFVSVGSLHVSHMRIALKQQFQNINIIDSFIHSAALDVEELVKHPGERFTFVVSVTLVNHKTNLFHSPAFNSIVCNSIGFKIAQYIVPDFNENKISYITSLGGKILKLENNAATIEFSEPAMDGMLLIAGFRGVFPVVKKLSQPTELVENMQALKLGKQEEVQK